MFGHRLVARGLAGVCSRMWGFPPTIIPLVVEHMGPLRALLWYAANFPRYLISWNTLGSVRTHLACAVVSLRNGCEYCAHGHIYALELLHLRGQKLLSLPFLQPWNATDLEDWIGLDDRALRQRLRATLVEAGLHAEALWTDRVLALADGSQQPVDAAESRIAHLVGMVTTMNRIAVAGGAAPDEAHDPVNKDAAVKARHAALRAAAASI